MDVCLIFFLTLILGETKLVSWANSKRNRLPKAVNSYWGRESQTSAVAERKCPLWRRFVDNSFAVNKRNGNIRKFPRIVRIVGKNIRKFRRTVWKRFTNCIVFIILVRTYFKRYNDYLISIIISLINYVIIVTSDQSDFEKFYILLFPFARYPYLSIIIVRWIIHGNKNRKERESLQLEKAPLQILVINRDIVILHPFPCRFMNPNNYPILSFSI